jgi:hypothetical protein
MVKSDGINGSKSHPSHFMGNPNIMGIEITMRMDG